MVHGIRLEGQYGDVSVAPGGGASVTLAYAAGVGDLFRTQIGAAFGGTMVAPALSAVGESTLIHQTAVPPARRTVDLTRDLLPRVPPPSYDRSVGDRPAMTWPAQAGLASADGVGAMFAWRETGEPTQLWMVLAPTSVGARVQLPALPAELASWAPTAFAAMDLGAVAFVESDWMASFTELRQRSGIDFLFDQQQSLFPPAGDAMVRLSVAGVRL